MTSYEVEGEDMKEDLSWELVCSAELRLAACLEVPVGWTPRASVNILAVRVHNVLVVELPA